MMASPRPISDDDLHAFVDGFLGPERRAEVELYLAEHPEAAARIAGWGKGNELLRQALDWKLREPVPERLSVLRLNRDRSDVYRSFRRMAASIVVALMVGAGAGWVAHGPVAPSGIAALGLEAAAAHRIFAASDMRSFRLDAVGSELASWTKERLGEAVTPPDLTAAGYRLAGERLVSTEHGPACVFFYQSEHGPTLSVFVRKMNGVDMNAPMRAMKEPDAVGYAWARNGVGVSLISTDPIPSLHGLSNRIRDSMKIGA
jgi:anti-sigma factor RsiW